MNPVNTAQLHRENESTLNHTARQANDLNTSHIYVLQTERLLTLKLHCRRM